MNTLAGMIDFCFHQQFDKLLMTAIICFFALLGVHAYHHGEKDLAAFAVDNAKLFSGALLTLITGKLLASKNGNGNGKVPNGQGPADH